MTPDQWRRFQATSSSSRSRGGASASADMSTMSAADGGGAASTEARMGNLFDVIRKWEANFGRHLQILLDALNHYAATETVVLLSLCARLSTANQGTEYAGRGNEDETSL